MKKTVGIIILHFGDWQITKNCLDSLSEIEAKDFNYKVIIINNSRDEIPNHKIVSKLINPKKNLGFAEGNNLGMKGANKLNVSYYLFLNNDTIIEKDFLAKLLDNLSEEDCIVGPILEHKVNGKTYYDYGGNIDWKKTQAKHTNKNKYVKDKPQKRDFVSGCCMLVSRKIIEKIGGFRQDYFLYLEDVELCLRAAKNGFNTYINPHSKIFHLGSASGTELKKIFYSLRNSLKLIGEYTPTKNKFSSYIFNLSFYPSILIWWQVKRIKRAFLS